MCVFVGQDVDCNLRVLNRLFGSIVSINTAHDSVEKKTWKYDLFYVFYSSVLDTGVWSIFFKGESIVAICFVLYVV